MNSNKTKVKKKIYIESVVLVLIALTPFFLKAYDYFPGPNSEFAHGPVSFLGIEIGSNGFNSIETNIWFYSNKLIPLILLISWFFTSKDWWYHILIIPIATYAFQLFELIFSEDNTIDTENIWWLIPVCMVVVPFVYFIRIKLYDKYVNGIDLEAMEVELYTLKEKQKKQQKIESTNEDLPRIEYRSLSEWFDQELSTENIGNLLRQLQNNLRNWLHLKF